MARCKGCGQEIIWIKTKSGKSIPCDPEMIYYKAKKTGHLRVVTPTGEVVSAVPSDSILTATDYGYVSHFATCPQADRFRRKR